jgi:CRISPR-associated protein Cpf1
MMVEHNAIVVMEDLNFGFKRGRFHIEKQMYQKFEKMLIDKLNYLVLKDTQDPKAPTGLLNALQLSNKFESFQKLGKQSGFIFYLPAYLTSEIDPTTGFVNQLRIKYDSIVKSQAYYRQFDTIAYNNTSDWFEFSFRYVNFANTTPSARKIPWTICTTHHPRYAWNKNSNVGNGGTEEYNVTKELKKLFDQYKIAYEEGTDLIESIASNTAVDFFKRLNKLLYITASLRHNNGKKGKEEHDFILSPVANSESGFFNSLEADETQPENADANGAYHIALKGLWALHSIRKTDTDRLSKLNLAVSNEEWLNFAQIKQYRSQSSS